MCEDCGTDWPDQDAAEIAKLKAHVEEMAERIASLGARLQTMVPWEPRDGWPTMEQVVAWKARGGVWGSSRANYLGYWQFQVLGQTIIGRDSITHRLCYSDQPEIGVPPTGVFPVLGGRPMSWAEVEAAVAEMAKNK